MKVLYDINSNSGVDGIRVATPADEDQLFMLLLHLHSENGMFNLNAKKLIEGIQWGTQGKGGIIYVIEEDGWIVASLGMLISSSWYSDDEYLMERWNFVHPNYRSKGNYARKLLEQAKWASDHFTKDSREGGFGPVPFQCGISSFDRTEGKVRLYARHMACSGAFFVYGELPLQDEKRQEQMRRVEEVNLQAHRDRSKRVIPLVETIIRMSQRQRVAGNGADHV